MSRWGNAMACVHSFCQLKVCMKLKILVKSLKWPYLENRCCLKHIEKKLDFIICTDSGFILKQVHWNRGHQCCPSEEEKWKLITKLRLLSILKNTVARQAIHVFFFFGVGLVYLGYKYVVLSFPERVVHLQAKVSRRGCPCLVGVVFAGDPLARNNISPAHRHPS